MVTREQCEALRNKAAIEIAAAKELKETARELIESLKTTLQAIQSSSKHGQSIRFPSQE